jgi:hypothetical protein
LKIRGSCPISNTVGPSAISARVALLFFLDPTFTSGTSGCVGPSVAGFIAQKIDIPVGCLDFRVISNRAVLEDVGASGRTAGAVSGTSVVNDPAFAF